MGLYPLIKLISPVCLSSFQEAVSKGQPLRFFIGNWFKFEADFSKNRLLRQPLLFFFPYNVLLTPSFIKYEESV